MPTTPEHILIIKHGALGDIILATGHLKAIRAQHPDAHIVCLTSQHFASLLSTCPYIDEVWVDTKPKLHQWRDVLHLRSRLRSISFRWVYDLQTSGRSSRYWWLMPWPKPHWSGVGRFISHPQSGNARLAMHTVTRLNDQLAIAGIRTQGTPDIHFLSASVNEFHLPERYALLVPGGSAHRPEKRWPASHYITLSQHLLAAGLTPVLIGGNAEADTLDIIAASNPHILHLGSKTSIAAVASLARGARLAVGNDTGPMHIIAAAECPSVILFSAASNPQKSAPIGQHVRSMQSADMVAITPEQVMAGLRDIGLNA